MVIKKNFINTCIFSLAEKTTLDPVYYLFEFKNTQDDTIKLFLATDISPNKISYNEFLIEETASEDLTLGKVAFDLVGSWTYRIFEQSSSTNLVVATSGNEVKIGRIDVTQDDEVQPSFSETRTIKIFNG